MELVLLRHGIAVPRDDPRCPPDEDRPLTEKGIRRTHRSARGLQALGAVPGAILVSPLLRARQTAEIAAGVFGLAPAATFRTDALRPEGDPRRVLDEARRLAESVPVERVLCVGHAPNLDRVLAAAVGATGGTVTSLGKAGAACVRWEGRSGRARLRWLIPPRLLRRLA